jgi:hypothetical protein
MIEAWLWTRLKTYAGITGIIGSDGDKVLPVFAPMDLEEPYITFYRVGTERQYNTLKQDGTPRVTFEINVWHNDYEQCKLLAAQVRLAIDGYRTDSGGYHIRRAFIEDERDILDPAEWGLENITYGVQFVLVVSHTETVPTYT